MIQMLSLALPVLGFPQAVPRSHPHKTADKFVLLRVKFRVIFIVAKILVTNLIFA
jgi:hypothetical protein